MNEKFKVCKSCLIDQETLNSFHPIILGGGDTAGKIEELKMNNAKLKASIEDEEKSIITSFPEQFRTERMSHTCLYLFYVCLSEMFLYAVARDLPNTCLSVTLYLNVFAILHAIVAWCFGGRKFSGVLSKILNFSSCMYSMIYYLLNLCCSIILGNIFPCPTDMSQAFIRWSFFICGFLPFLNFIVYAIWLYYTSRKIKKETKNKCDKYAELCEPLRRTAETLVQLDKMVIDMNG